MYETELAERYVSALTREIEAFSGSQQVDTIYFGGGTPSLLSSSQLETILASVDRRFAVSARAEITMEMNPGTVTLEILREFRRLGVNRASFGAQTFDDRELAKLGRSHTSAETRQTFQSLRDAGFENVSFDLIAGLPGQTLADWNRNLDEAFALMPEHLSFYLLEVHQGTPLAEHIRKGIQPVPDEDLAGQMYEAMIGRAAAAGYRHYEISNLCRAGFESRHNSKYWTGAPYYGFGCSAHSYDGQSKRWANERDIGRYLDRVENESNAVVGETELSAKDLKAEAVFLGLRMMDGLSVRQHQEKFGVDLRKTHADDLERFREAGLIELSGDMLRLTRAGAVVSNEVFAALI